MRIHTSLDWPWPWRGAFVQRVELLSSLVTTEALRRTSASFSSVHTYLAHGHSACTDYLLRLILDIDNNESGRCDWLCSLWKALMRHGCPYPVQPSLQWHMNRILHLLPFARWYPRRRLLRLQPRHRQQRVRKVWSTVFTVEGPNASRLSVSSTAQSSAAYESNPPPPSFCSVILKAKASAPTTSVTYSGKIDLPN